MGRAAKLLANTSTALSLALGLALAGLWAIGWDGPLVYRPPKEVIKHVRPVIAFGSGVVSLGTLGPVPATATARRGPWWRREWGGFKVERAGALLVGAASGRPIAGAYTHLDVPQWAATAAALAPAAARLGYIGMVRRRRRHRLESGRCACCGYDLRASAGRCPECGNEATTEPPHNQPLQRTGDAVE